MTAEALPNVFALTPLDPKFRADPHDALNDLRTCCIVNCDEVRPPRVRIGSAHPSNPRITSVGRTTSNNVTDRLRPPALR